MPADEQTLHPDEAGADNGQLLRSRDRRWNERAPCHQTHKWSAYQDGELENAGGGWERGVDY